MIIKKFRGTFIDEVLGSLPNNEEIYRAFIGSKAPDAASVEDEVASLGADEVAEQGMTVFFADDEGNPYIKHYHVKGFFKGACGFMRRVPGSKSEKMRAYKKQIDGNVNVIPERIFIQGVDEITENQRPLRAQTAQGDRVALACSEQITRGTTFEFIVVLNNDGDNDCLTEWLNFGIWNGIGQWRNSGKGRFVWQELDEYNNVIPGVGNYELINLFQTGDLRAVKQMLGALAS